jgi:tetratricopeptide (TPR) repeat protein
MSRSVQNAVAIVVGVGFVLFLVAQAFAGKACAATDEAWVGDDLQVFSCSYLIVTGGTGGVSVGTAYNNRAIVYHEQEAYDLAAADYAMALKLEPTNEVTLTNRGELHIDVGENDKAIPVLDRAIARNPDLCAAVRFARRRVSGDGRLGSCDG